MFEQLTERRTDFLIRNSQFLYAITNALEMNRRLTKFLAFIQTVEPTSH